MLTLPQVSGVDMRRADRETETETGQNCRQQMNKMYKYAVLRYNLYSDNTTDHSTRDLFFAFFCFQILNPKSDFSLSGKIFLSRTEKQI